MKLKIVLLCGFVLFGFGYFLKGNHLNLKNEEINSGKNKEASELKIKKPKESLVVEVERVIDKDSKKLPPYPSKEDVLHSFPDVNKNGVRDDIEVSVNEDFEDDQLLVGALLNSAYFIQKELDVALVGNFSLADAEKSMKQIELASGCINLYYSNFYAKELGFDWLSIYNLYIHSETYNTEEKRVALKRIQENSHGISGGFLDINHEVCKDFIGQF